MALQLTIILCCRRLYCVAGDDCAAQYYCTVQYIIVLCLWQYVAVIRCGVLQCAAVHCSV